MSSHEIVVCDECGAVEKKEHGPHYLTVQNWLIPGVVVFDKRVKHFCSWKCLHDFAKSKCNDKY